MQLHTQIWQFFYTIINNVNELNWILLMHAKGKEIIRNGDIVNWLISLELFPACETRWIVKWCNMCFCFVGCMLCLGRSNYFRFNHPKEAKKIKEAMPNCRISCAPLAFLQGIVIVVDMPKNCWWRSRFYTPTLLCFLTTSILFVD